MSWTQEVYGGNPVVHTDPSMLFSKSNMVEPYAEIPYVDFIFDIAKIGMRTYRWKTALQFNAGNYLFEYDAVDGVRAYINDILLVPKYPGSNSWKEQSQTKYSAQCSFPNSGMYNLRVEYYSSKYSGRVRFYWNLKI
jgi:hypothetical protein